MNALNLRRVSVRSLVNDPVLGMVALIIVFLPWNLMEMTKLTRFFEFAQRWADKAGFPLILGHIVTVTISLGILVGIGYVIRNFVRGRLDRFPMIAGLLDSGEQISNLFAEDGVNRVVILDWPNDDVRCLANLMSETECEETGEKMAVVYIPDTPNPASGMMRLVNRTKLTMTDMKASQFLTSTLSRGALTRPRLRLARMAAPPIDEADKRSGKVEEKSAPDTPARS